MKIIRSAKQFQKILEACRRQGKSVGFVPTMGALHAGHLALVKTSKKENKISAVSIFVNPAQFGPREDFKKYPRVLVQDTRLLREAGVDYLFYPSVQEIYPEGCAASIKFENFLTQKLCGKFRPGHFEGVATVVAKLFALSGPCRAYFGAKDFQQTVVIKQLVRDLLFPVEVKVCPTIREKDGLAMSSRNRYLNLQERLQAAAIPQTLFSLKNRLQSVKRNLAALKKQAVKQLRQNGLRVQYFELADPETLVPLKKIQPRMLAATACFAGKTRLIDNVIIRP